LHFSPDLWICSMYSSQHPRLNNSHSTSLPVQTSAVAQCFPSFLSTQFWKPCNCRCNSWVDTCSKIRSPPQNSRRQKSDMKQATHWESANFKRHDVKCRSPGHLARGVLCAPHGVTLCW
jgi:hypothetical protein